MEAGKESREKQECLREKCSLSSPVTFSPPSRNSKISFATSSLSVLLKKKEHSPLLSHCHRDKKGEKGESLLSLLYASLDQRKGRDGTALRFLFCLCSTSSSRLLL